MDGWNERKKERICVIGIKTKKNQFPKFVKMSTLSAEKNVFRKTRDVNFRTHFMIIGKMSTFSSENN